MQYGICSIITFAAVYFICNKPTNLKVGILSTTINSIFPPGIVNIVITNEFIWFIE